FFRSNTNSKYVQGEEIEDHELHISIEDSVAYLTGMSYKFGVNEKYGEKFKRQFTTRFNGFRDVNALSYKSNGINIPAVEDIVSSIVESMAKSLWDAQEIQRHLSPGIWRSFEVKVNLDILTEFLRERAPVRATEKQWNFDYGNTKSHFRLIGLQADLAIIVSSTMPGVLRVESNVDMGNHWAIKEHEREVARR
ncbi:hypothetical protein PENTCL1PPCAC_12134, partial [Pristionchus entomophagus]